MELEKKIYKALRKGAQLKERDLLKDPRIIIYVAEANDLYYKVENELFSSKPYVLLMPVNIRETLIRLMQAAQFVMANEKFEIAMVEDENGVLDEELVEVTKSYSVDTNTSPCFGVSSDDISKYSG